MKRILLLDDSLTIQKVVKLTFTNSVEFEVRFAQSRKEATELLEQKKPDVVIAYIRFGGEAKPEYFLELRKHCPSILLLAESNEVLTSFEQAGFGHFLRKPFLREELKSAVQGLLPLAYSTIPPMGNEFSVTELDDQPTQAAGAVKSGVFPAGLTSIPRPPAAPVSPPEHDATVSRVTLNIPPPPPGGNLGPRTSFSASATTAHIAAFGNTALASTALPINPGPTHTTEEVPPSFRSTLSIPAPPQVSVELNEKPSLSFSEATKLLQQGAPTESRFSVSLVAPLVSPAGQPLVGSSPSPVTNPLVRTTYAPTSVPSILNGAIPEIPGEISQSSKPSFKPAFEMPEVTMDLAALERSYKATMTAKQALEMPLAAAPKAFPVANEDKRFVDINSGTREAFEASKDTNAALGFDELVLEIAENLETIVSPASKRQSRPEILIEPAVEPEGPLILEDVTLRTKSLNSEKPIQSKPQTLNLEELPFPNHWRKEVENTLDDALFRALERAVPAKIDQKIEYEWPHLVTTVTSSLVKELKESIPNIVERIVTQELQIFRPRLEEIVLNEARSLHAVHLKNLESIIQSEVEKNVASQVKVWLAAEAINLAKDIVKEEIRHIMSEN